MNAKSASTSLGQPLPFSLEQLHVKIFADGADQASMMDMYRKPWIKGFTTNPSLVRKAGVTDFRGFAKEMVKQIPDRPLSFEVFADDLAEMKRQALEIKTWGEQVYVKIPITNSLGESCVPLVRDLTRAGVKLNVTALFTLEQVHQTCEALREGAPALVSVFAGRIADSGRDPVPTMLASKELCRWAGPEVELLWASTREVYNILEADRCGCDIITVPFEILKKLGGLGKDLNTVSLDTVKAFKTDSDAAGFKL